MNCNGTSSPSTFTGYAGTSFVNLINTLMAAQCALDPRSSYPGECKLDHPEDFDFIVVGAGSAGSVVANRLTENPKWNVLLIEAGTYPSITSEIPALFRSLEGTEEDWQYKTINPGACLGFVNETCKMSRGKLLGGCSAINVMLYVRGNDRDYNHWEELGNKNWNWNEAMRYFKKSENLKCEALMDSPNHSTGGYLTTSSYKSNRKVRNVILDAVKELGTPITIDAEKLGFYESLMNIEDGKRCSASKAFISKIKERENLHVSVNNEVVKVLIDPSTKVVSGVEVRNKFGNLIKIKATKEVILSAGSINTPQILLKSGIGRKEDLDRINVNQLHDLAVGKNLQDHPIYIGLYIQLNESVSDPIGKFDDLDHLYNYLLKQDGPLSNMDLTNILGFISTTSEDYPDIEFHLNYFPKDPTGDKMTPILKFRGVNEVTSKSIIEANKHYNLLRIMPTILKPKSVGEVHLTSSTDKPSIYTNFLKEIDDLETIERSIKYVKNLVATEAMKLYDAKILKLNIPNCNELVEPEYWRCSIRHFINTINHPVGTAKMGPDSDPDAVVNDRLSVKGVKNLRVIDGSIMPDIVSANTNAPIIMIGEKGSDLIKEDWGFPIEY